MTESRQLQRYYRCREQGLCYRCGKPHDTDKVLCPECHVKNLSTPRDPAKESAKRNKAWAKVRAVVIEGYGGCCACCGERRPYVLDVDHVEGDGSAHRRAVGKYRVMKDIAKADFPSTFQILCANCHAAKTRLGACPQDHPSPIL